VTKPETSRRFAPAKINLFLHVGDKRADGYHDLLSLIVFADMGDWLSLKPAAALSLGCTGPFAAALANESDNLVLRAARALMGWAKERRINAPPVALTLEKNLPVASGIGGGSADAAAALLMLASHWSLPIAIDEMRTLGLSLGADVPVCLRGQPALVAGIGETLSAAPPLPRFWLVLVNPGVAVATAPIFKALRARSGVTRPRPFSGSTAHEFALWLDHTTNDLTAPATALAPVITQVEAAITATEGCLLARMSGSGATCFGLYGSQAAADSAAASLAKSHPDWWARAARCIDTSGETAH
jgi:4-diphosphocytidyl-2-C-methyl-D-erythritol kinase